MIRTHRARTMFLVFAATLASLPAWSAPISGTFSAPVGTVKIAEKNGMVVAKMADAKNPCQFAAGTVVFEGSRLDDSIVGTLKTCRVGDGCGGNLDGAAMLLVAKGGAVLSGAVHLETGGCKTPVGGDAISFRKTASAAPKKPRLATGRQEAERLATEAHAEFRKGGTAEAARAKFEAAVKADPSFAVGYIGIGYTYYVRERYGEALEYYQKALEYEPSIGDAYYNIACVHALRGDSEQALRFLRIALLNGYVQLNTLDEDPDLNSLRGTPAFEELRGRSAAPAATPAPSTPPPSSTTPPASAPPLMPPVTDAPPSDAPPATP